MESPELRNEPEIQEDRLKQLESVINTLKLEEYEEFEFEGLEFLLLLFPPEDLGVEGMAWFTKSTHIEGFDIYLLEILSSEDKKAMLFWGVVEAYLQWEGFDVEIAHKYALERQQEFFPQFMEQ